jgi:hypothetical protein
LIELEKPEPGRSSGGDALRGRLGLRLLIIGGPPGFAQQRGEEGDGLDCLPQAYTGGWR